MAKYIVAYRRKVDSIAPWRVKVDGKADPRNREFQDPQDIRDTYELLKMHGYYQGYELMFPFGEEDYQ